MDAKFEQMVSRISSPLLDTWLCSTPGASPSTRREAGVAVLYGAGVIVRGGFRGGVLFATGVVGVDVGVFVG